jgi:ATP-binding cassette subfamily F protein uup
MADLLLSARELAKDFGAAPLFEGLSFGVFEGDHMGLVGPNGSGKTTLLRILAGLEEPTAGERAVRRRLRIGYVPQDPTFPEGATVGSVLRAAAGEVGAGDGDRDGRIAIAQGRSGLRDAEQRVGELSGGWRKRLAIASALAGGPELLLLDEPTNHLDLDGILWLEDLLRREPEAFVAVSHDRYFLESVTTRVLELNRAYAGGLLEARGRYRDFLEKKDAALASQASYQESLRNRVRGELDWLSRKARARTRKAQARIDEAGRLRDELADLDSRSASATARIQFAATDRRTRRLVVAEGATRRVGGRTIVQGLDLVLAPGTRLGLLGANGSGKTNLLRLLAGQDPPDEGTVTHAPGLRVVVFDQHRSRLEPGVSLARTLAPAGDSVIVQGRAVHVAGWAKRFLFRPEQLETPIERLSGGERARVLIARLMLEPADVLLLDEPTNDLDIPTLEVLEESLLEFPGALVLVTHDRYLLDRVSTRLLSLDGRGGVTPYADYAQWEAARAPEPVAKPAKPSPVRSAPRPAKLSWRDQRDWEGMEQRILDAELTVEERRRAAGDPLIASDHVALSERMAALAAAEAAVADLYARWAELEEKVAKA